MQDELQEDPHKYSSVGVAARLGDLVGLQEIVWHGSYFIYFMVLNRGVYSSNIPHTQKLNERRERGRKNVERGREKSRRGPHF